MDRKILIGSIIAVVILVLMSFTGVVGYQTTKSSTIAKTSPLYNIRTNRAIGEESKDLTAKYVGKGITLLFPERNDRAVLTKIIIDNIRRMDDKAFERFIASIINYAAKYKRFNGVTPNEFKEVFYLLRDSDESIPILDADTENKYPSVGACRTWWRGIGGFLECVKRLLLLPFIIISEFLDWCFNIQFGATASLLCVTAHTSCGGCPRTIRRLLS